jgi:YVTN family beta-propeller protein
MKSPSIRTVTAALMAAAAASFSPYVLGRSDASESSKPAPLVTPSTDFPGMPPVVDRRNIYSETGAGHMSASVAGALERVYVPNRIGGSVSVIDPRTLKVIDTFKVGSKPQHVVPSWDLRTLWVANNAERSDQGSLTPIDPLTGKPGQAVPVDDPYNMYWSPDGRFAIVVAEAFKRLDFRDARSMALEYSIATPGCDGLNHADFSVDGRIAYFTCEFNGSLTKVDLIERRVVDTIKLTPYYARPDVLQLLATPGKKPRKIPDPAQIGGEICTVSGMPQDVRSSPDGAVLFVADMMVDGVHVVDSATFRQIGFITTGVGAHGLYPSRDGKLLYVANRGNNSVVGVKKGKGSVSVIDFATRKVVRNWPVPGGGSPDMGNLSADGKYLWLSGRFDDVVYRFDTATGAIDTIKVGREPHGLTVWPQPGRYCLGHTGNMR